MERIREGRRSASAAGIAAPSVTRRPRVKETSDDEDRMDETADTRSWERSKKERLTNFHVSSSMSARNKRKRQLLQQESQFLGGRLNPVEETDEFVEETEAQVSEDDDEPPPPPLMRKPGPGKARIHTKEDEILMDIPAVPRKARSTMSASSRYSSMARRQSESQHSEIIRQKLATPSQTPLNGSSSPNLLQKQGKKLKPVVPKVRAMKVPTVAEVSSLSDQEAEVAEALFDLSRSLPSHSNGLEAKAEVKLEPEKTCSPPIANTISTRGLISHIHGLHHPVSCANGYVASHIKDVIASNAEASKRKRPRVVKSEDGKVPTPVRLMSSVTALSSASPSGSHQPCVGETELDSLPEKIPTDTARVKGVTDAALCEVKSNPCESEDMEQGEFVALKQEPGSVAVKEEALVDRSGEGADAADILRENESNSMSELATRPAEAVCDVGSTAKLNIDLMASPLKHNAMEEDGSGSTTERQNVGENCFVVSTGQSHIEDQAKLDLVVEDAVKVMDVAGGLSMIKEKVGGIIQELNDAGNSQACDLLQMDQVAMQSGREEEEREKSTAKTICSSQEEVLGNAATTPFVSSTVPAAISSSAPIPLSGWMAGLPHLGFYGPGAPPWAAGASLSNSGADVKAAHSALQLPHSAVLLPPVQRMKRCATHVFIALFIYREQHVSRQSLWSTAFCRAAPYNLNIPPVNILDNDKLVGHYSDTARQASAQQSGPSYGYTIAQGGGPSLAGSSTPGTMGMMPGSNHVSSAGGSGDIGNTSVTSVIGATSSNVMAAHAQYLQAIMQQNGFASFPFPFSGPHGQGAQFFNGPFFPPHIMHPPIPQAQALAQQSGNVLKQQQSVGSLPHSNLQLAAPPIQQQLQLQLAPQSPSQSQHTHNNVGMSVQQFGIHVDKDNTAGVESASTAESRLSAIQRNMITQNGPSNLPNLNISAPPLMLGTTLPGLPPHDQDGSSLVFQGVKHSGKGQPQFPSQNATSLSSMQPHQFPTGSASGLQLKVLDTTSHGYSTLARGPVNPGTLGLASSMMGTPSLGVLPASLDGSKGSGQQQTVYGGHGQHFQTSMTKVSTSDEAYAIKARDYTDEKRNSIKPVGVSSLISRVDMEACSSLQGSPTTGNASNARIAGAIGRSVNSGMTSDSRSSRPASSAGSGQVPLLQSQPPPKQAMVRAKTVSGSANVAATAVGSHSVAAYAERVLPGNLGKFSGTGLPYAGQMAPSSQSSKPVQQAGVTKAGQRASSGPAQQQMPNVAVTKNHGHQQVRSSQPGVPSTPPRMPPSVTAPVLPAGAVSMSTPHVLSASKALNAASSKNPASGKGSASVNKAGPPTKKPQVSGPAITSGLSSVQPNLSSRASTQQKGPGSGVHVPQFHQQASAISAHQQRLPTTKGQVYPQMQAQQGQYKQPFQAQSTYRPQLFLQQHQQQYMQQQSPQQQQAVSHHQQASVSQHYLQNPQSSSQLCQPQASQPISHLQQFQPVAGSNGLSLNAHNLTLGTSVSGNISGNISSNASSDGGVLKTNLAKGGYTSANPLASGGLPEIISTAHSTVSGQPSSPITGSSPYLQLAAVKSNEQKPMVSDVASREEITNGRHLASPSSSQAAVASNPSSSGC